jgi:hypothetical protein
MVVAFSYTTYCEKKLLQNALFLFIPGSYTRGWTLTNKTSYPVNSLDPKGRHYFGFVKLCVYGASCLSSFPWGK